MKEFNGLQPAIFKAIIIYFTHDYMSLIYSLCKIAEAIKWDEKKFIINKKKR